MNNSEVNADYDVQEVVAGIHVEHEIASIRRRALALAIDYGIVGTIMYGVFIILGLIIAFGFGVTAFGVKQGALGEKGAFTMGAIGVGIIAIFVIAGLIGYHWYFIHYESKSGQTLGKKMLGLKVLSIDGTRLTRRQAITREVVRYIDIMVLLPGLISCLVTEKKQRIGDIFARTKVIYSKEQESESNFLYISKEDYESLLTIVKPQDISLKAYNHFLKDAFALFIKKQNIGNLAISKYEGYFRSKIEDPNLNIDTKSLLLFFAEHATQLNQKQLEGK